MDPLVNTPSWEGAKMAGGRSDTRAADAYIRRMNRGMAKACRAWFNLPRGWEPDLVVDWSERRTDHWGGTGYDSNPEISLAGREIRPGKHYEYRQYRDDPTIGSMDCRHWKSAALLLLAHEMAHCVQFYRLDRRLAALGPNKRVKDAAHGPIFQWIYRKIREGYANDRIKRVEGSARKRKVYIDL